MNQTNQQGMIARNRGSRTPATQAPTSIKGWLKAYSAEISKALPAQIGQDRFNRICMSAITNNAKLNECTAESFIGAVLNAAQLGLEPNTPLGHSYLIPFRNNKKGVTECQFQIGYKGLIELARRSGQISMIKAETVYQNDDFHYELGLNPNIHHVPAHGDRGQPVAYYAFYKTRDGDFDFAVAYKQEMLAHARRYSKAYSSGPWKDNFDEMAKKTLIKRVLKYAPLSTEAARAVVQDDSVKLFDPKDESGMACLALAPNQIDYEEAEEGVWEEKVEEAATPAATEPSQEK